MPFYHLRINYATAGLTKLLFRDAAEYQHFHDLSINTIKELSKAKKKHDLPNRVLSINVYQTEKSSDEYMRIFEYNINVVRRKIFDGVLGVNVTKQFFPDQLLKEGTSLIIDDLINSAKFLGLDANWFLATCALQLQETMVERLAKEQGISLKRDNLKKILERDVESKSSDYIPFKEKYLGFSKKMKTYGITMPNLTLALRKPRSDILHGGYNLWKNHTKTKEERPSSSIINKT